MAERFNTGNGAEPAEYTVGSLEVDDNQPVSSYTSQIGNPYPVENLEVHDPNAVVHSSEVVHPLVSTFKLSRRRAVIVSLIITLIVVLLTAGAIILLVKYGGDSQDSAKLPKQQDITLKDAQDSTIPSEFEGEAKSLLVNGDVVTRGSFKVSDGANVTVLRLQSGTSANQSIFLPNSSGTLCLDSNNCGFADGASIAALQNQLSSLQGQLGVLTSNLDGLSGATTPAGVDTLNGQRGSLTVQGSLNRIGVTTSNGVVTLTTPQNLDANANVQFGSLSLSSTGQIRANKLIQTGAGNSIDIDAGSDMITFTAGGRVFQLPVSGGATQTICTTGATCATGSGTSVLLSPSAVQVDGTADASIFINDTGGGNLIQLQSGGVDRLVVANNGNTTIGGTLTVAALANGFVKSTGGLLTVQNAINLASADVSGVLPVSNGGTGVNTIPANGVVVGNGTSPVSTVVAGGVGLCLVSTAGTPSFQACPGSGGVTSVNSQTGTLTIAGTTNQVNVTTTSGTITLSTPQNIHVGASPTFAGLTLSGLGNGPIKASAGVLGTGNINLGSEVSGLLGVTFGGTGANDASGARTNLGAAASGANTDITSLTPSGTLTVGSAGQILTLQGSANSSISANNGANVTTLGFAAPSGTNTITLPALSGTVCLSSGNCATAGAAGGDLTGNYPNPTIAKLQGTDLNISGAAGGHVLIYNSSTNRWENRAITGDITISGTGVTAIANGAVTSAKIADGTITGTDIANGTIANSNLQNNSLTVTAGNGLTSGGSVSLGGTTTLNIGQGDGITVSANDIAVDNTVCRTSGNCLGNGAGDVTGTGSVNRIAMFDGTKSLTTSTLLQSAGNLTLDSGNNFVVTSGNLVLNSGNVNVTGGGSFTGTVSGSDAVNNDEFVTLSQLNTAVGGIGGGVTSLNTLAGALGLQGTAGQISVVSNGSDTLTLSLNSAVTLQGNTFNGANQLVRLDGSGALPVLDGANLTNLNATHLASGTVDSARIAGSYTGITGVGTVTTGTWNGNAIADAYIQDNITISSLGSVDWAALDNYPGACPAGQAITQLGDTITCQEFAASSGSGNYIQNTTANQNNANLNIQSSATGSVTAKFRLLASQTADVIQVRDETDNTTLFAVTPSGGVIAASFTGDGSGLTGLNASNIATGTLNTARIADGSLGNNKLANNSLTVAAGNGLIDGGGISLGGSTTLNIGQGDGINVNANDIAVDNTVCRTSGNCAGVGGTGDITGSGAANRLAMFDASKNITDSTLLQSAGALTLDNGNNFVLAGGNINVTGSGSFTGRVSGANAVSNNEFVTLQQLNAAVGGVGGGVGSLNGLAGDLDLQGTAGQITVSDNGTDTITLALHADVTLQGNTFNGANQLVQLGGSGELPVLDGSNLTNVDAVTLGGQNGAYYLDLTNATGTLNIARIADGSLTNAKLQNSSVTVTAGNGLTDGGSVSLGGSTTLNIGAGDGITVNANDVAVDATVARLNANANFTANLQQGGNDVCTTAGNCAGVGGVGDITGSGTANRFAVFDANKNITNSYLLQSANTLTLDSGTNFVLTAGDLTLSAGNLNVTGDGTFSGSLTAASFSGDGLNLTNLNASNLGSGTVASARISGSYTGISGVGTVTVGTWNGTAITDAYIQDNITISSAGSVDWGALTAFPSACGGGQAVTAVGGTLTCQTFMTTGDGGVTSVGAIDSQTKSSNGAVVSGATLYMQTADGLNPGLVSTGSQTFAGDKTFNDNVTVAAQKTITLVGGSTAQRPVSPSEGTLYFDTTTKQLLVYANGKWQGDRSTATKIVAASNSSQAVKDSADYVATGTADQATINTALTAAAGGKVYLAEGTYIANATISVPNNTTLAGAGNGTLIELRNYSGDDLIENTDQSTGTGVVVQDLAIDGRKDIGTDTQYGVYLYNASGTKLNNLRISRFGDDGVHTYGSNNTTVSGSYISDNSSNGVSIAGENNTISSNNFTNNGIGINAGFNNRSVISGNTVSGSVTDGIWVFSSNTTISNNVISSSGGSGIRSGGIENSSITGNTIDSSAEKGIYVDLIDYSTISGNIVTDSGEQGIYVIDGHSGAISDNSIRYAEDGLVVNGWSQTITGNTITDVNENGIVVDGWDGIVTGNNVGAYMIGISIQGDRVTASNNRVTTMSGESVAFYINGGGGTITGNTAMGPVAYQVTSSNNTITGNTASASEGAYQAFYISNTNNTISSNSVSSGWMYGIYLEGAHESSISSNMIYGVGYWDTAPVTASIYLEDADSNSITNNIISSDDTSYYYDIYITGIGSENNYIADNTIGTMGVNDLGTNTIYGGQTNASGNFIIQPAGTIELMKNTNITGDLNVTGNTDINGSLTVGNANQFVISNTGVVTSGTWNGTAVEAAYGGTGLTSYTTGDLLYASGTTTIAKLAAVAIGSCLRSNGIGAAPIWGNCSGTGDVLQDGNSFGVTMTVGTNDAQVLAFETGGTRRFDIASGASTLTGQGTTTITSTGSLNLETTGASAITIGGTNTTGINLNKNVTIAAQQTIRFVGGTTAQRPVSPSEGMLYFDTTTKQLLTYANGKWQGDRSTSTKIVAANDSSQAVKDAADYVAGATNTQTTINTALTAAAGGKVYLAEGTYTINASISIPNNTILVGSGQGTLITIPNSLNASINAITNATTGGNGTGITIQDLRLDGNQANQASGTMRGIYLDGMGSGTGASAKQGAKVTNVTSSNWNSSGFYLTTSSNNTLTNNTAQTAGVNTAGFFLMDSPNNTLSNNTVQGGSNQGITVYYSDNNAITGNTVQASDADGIRVYFSSGNTVSGNTVQGNANYGFHINNGTHNTFANNVAQDNGSSGFFLEDNSNSNTLTSNVSRDNTFSSGFYLDNSFSNTLSANTSAGNTSGFYMWNGSGNNTLTGNTSQDSSMGFYLSYTYDVASNSIIGNTAQGASYGFYLEGVYNATITGNTAQSNSDTGFHFSDGSSNNTLTGNTIRGNNIGIGLNAGSDSNVLSANTITNSGGTSSNDGIMVASNSNTIVGNTISDTDGHSNHNYAIHIYDTNADNNYIADNNLGGASIRDVGTNTTYGGQMDSSGVYSIQNATAGPLFNADTVNGRISIGTNVSTNATLHIEGRDKGSEWTPRSAAEANTWESVTYGNGLFVAVSSDGTNRVMTSPDGITWTARSAAGNNDAWLSVTYGNGLFVAVGNGGDYVMTSSDGITWTAQTAAQANYWTSVTYGNGLFVAVAATGTNRVMTSSDGITWTAQTAAQANNWYSVTYGNSLFVAVATTGTNRVMTSSDGITWTAQTAAQANSWRSVTYGNGTFVAIANTGLNRVMTSANGVTWSTASVSGGNWYSVAYGDGTFVAVSDGSGSMTSSDGNAWTTHDVPEYDGWFSVTYGRGTFVAVSGSFSTNRVMTSGGIALTVSGTTTMSDALRVSGEATFSGGISVRMLAGGGANGVCHTGTAAAGATTDTRQLTACSTAASDYAEYYPTEEDVEAAEIVALTSNTIQYEAKAYDKDTGAEVAVGTKTSPVLKKAAIGDNAIGFVSTYPHQVIGTEIPESAHRMPVALNGRIPVKVNNEGGEIHAGDMIALSTVPGVATKAYVAGKTFGVALEDFDGTTGTIMVYVQSGYFNPVDGANLQAQSMQLAGSATIGGNLNVTGAVTIDSLTVTGDVAIEGSLTVVGAVSVGTLTVNGHIVTAGNAPTVAVGTAAGQVNTQAMVNGNDSAGTVSVTSGSENVSTGVLAHVSFEQAFNGAYKVVISASNDSAGLVRVHTVKTSTGFDIVANDPVIISTQYDFDYIVIGTQ